MESTDDQLRTPAHQYGVGAGCFMMLLGAPVAIIATVVAGKPPSGTAQLVGAIGGFTALAGVIIIIGFGAVGTWLARKRVRALGWPPLVADDGVPSVRRLERHRFPATVRLAKFPTAPVVDSIVPGPTPTRLLINVPPLLRWRKKSDPVEPATAYQWLRLPQALPVLVVAPDTGGDGVILRDVEIESEAFNRRFRVSGDLDGESHGDLARYATAVLHPRAAEILMDLPRPVVVVITEDLLGAVGMVDHDPRRYQLIAEVLGRFAASIPRLVWDIWGGSDKYRR